MPCVPGRGQEVEDAVEHVVQVSVALVHQQHEGVAAGRAHQSSVDAALLPQGLQRRALHTAQVKTWSQTPLQRVSHHAMVKKVLNTI